MRRWLARLAFAFLVVAFALAWEGYHASTGQRGPVAQGRVVELDGGHATCGAADGTGTASSHSR